MALVVTVSELPPIERPEAYPVMLVPTRAVGVPRAGVTRVGLVARTLSPVPELATLIRLSEASVATADEAVSPDTLAPDIEMTPASSNVAVEFLIIRPVVPSNLVIALSVAPTGPVTSPVPTPVGLIKTIDSVPSSNFR